MIQIKAATPADLEAIETLWSKVFGDDVAFIEEFYGSCCKIEQTIVLKEDDTLCTVGALLPVTLCLPDGSTAKGAYLYGMATDPDAQGKGFGQIFLKYVDFYLDEHFRHGTISAHPNENKATVFLQENDLMKPLEMKGNFVSRI